MSGEGDAGDEESRSDRLRRRRSQRQQHGAESGSAEAGGDASGDDPGDGSTPSEPSERSKPSEQGETEDRDGVKSEQVGTYMYLPKDQKKDVERLYNVLKAEYEHEFDIEFEKNRQFYPLLVHFGLERLEGLDASEIRERLESL